MKLNPFEYLENEYKLEDILVKSGWNEYDPKEEYKGIFGDYTDYETLVKSINTKIDWHIFTTGGYQGDYYYIAQYDNKIYFVDIGYGSCSGCDALMGSLYDINKLIDLQDSIKRNIREFDNLEELISYVNDTTQYWSYYRNELLDFIKKEFNIDFEIIKVVKIKN